jgi:PD-(D/E)XK endonuclease
MERLINRRQQGDLGEASAIEWFTRQGATVFAPLGHSPDIDLVAEIRGRMLRIQVKTSVCRTRTPNGHERFEVQLATLGGNQSWSGHVKHFDPTRVDVLFVLVGDGRRWLIPSLEIESVTSLHLGGPKYSEFEIERAGAIDGLVIATDASLESRSARGSAGAWRAGPACKVGAFVLSEFESHLPHSQPSAPSPPPVPTVVRGSRPRGQTRVSGHRQIAIPKRAFEAAELARGDRLKAFALGPGEIVFRRIAREHNDDGPPRGGPSSVSRRAVS